MALEEQVVDRLIHLGYTVSFAESCTGGLCCGTLVNVANASKVLNASFVTYANAAKIRFLGVEADTILNYGVVSEQVAAQMARGAARTAESDVGVGITGIAGPGGGTPEKPVGTVWIAAALKDMVVSECCHFGTEREDNIRLAANTALRMLQQLL